MFVGKLLFVESYEGSKVQGPRSKVQGPRSKVRGPKVQDPTKKLGSWILDSGSYSQIKVKVIDV